MGSTCLEQSQSLKALTEAWAPKLVLDLQSLVFSQVQQVAERVKVDWLHRMVLRESLAS